MSSLDILAYAFLKAELVNSPDSEETKELVRVHANLVEFVGRMDSQVERFKNSKAINLENS